ncbi:hypothetical protein NEHOM01_1894 [Nematocida homosporus]|uniref:uncharacterized protein n=1 Tax=Nematocida homosporus TaxID=1912981 RepID=UPI00221F2680|nr:uncharacterized protein NEHOM01_1894 [Nematocida homosporus]KAI5187055.1 hypothetical protein NEHOM01_1894 [Nematocida homosporus]
MANQKKIIVIGLQILIGLCMFVLRCRGSAAILETKKSTNGLYTLKELADRNFVWAQDTLERYYKGYIVHPASGDKFIDSGFYETLGFKPAVLPRVKQIASYLKAVFEGTWNAFSIPRDFVCDVPDLLMLYMTLTRPINGSKSKKYVIHPDHESLVENLAKYIYLSSSSEDINLLEEVFSTYVLKEGSNQASEKTRQHLLICKPTLISNKNDLDLIFNSPLINYIHPLNSHLYMCGYNYLYDSETKTFLVTETEKIRRGNKPLAGMVRRAGFTFDDAVRLRRATNNQYTILSDDIRNYHGFLHKLGDKIQNPNACLEFRFVVQRSVEFDVYRSDMALRSKIY